MKKYSKILHRWLALPLGLLISLICFTGGLLVFEKEITAFAQRSLYSVQPQGSVLPVDSLMTIAEAHAPEGTVISGITLSGNPERAAQVAYKGKRGQGLAINPYTGEVKGEYSRPKFFTTTQNLHRFLLVKTANREELNWGQQLVGIATLSLTLLLLTGLLLWWPRNLKMFKNRVCVTGKKGVWRLLCDLHISGGFWALLFLLTMALTGPTWTYKWYNSALRSITGAQQKAKTGGPETEGSPSKEALATPNRSQWAKAVKAVSANYPKGYETLTIADEEIKVNEGKLGNTRATDQYGFNAQTGDITQVKLYAETPSSAKFQNWIFSLHAGAFAGIFSKILWFLAALLGTLLPLTGYYLWWKRCK